MSERPPLSTCPICGHKWPRKSADYCSVCGYCRHTESRVAIATTRPPSDTEPPDEQQIGQYKIIQQIAKGGMGEIFLAYDPICRRNIALKRIREDLQSRQRLRRRFLREAWITSHLSHPGVIPIYNIHVEGEQLYYTMPYVEGETLRDYLRRARKAQKEGIECPAEATIPALTRSFLTLCQTIAYSHAHGVIHRDLKPDNIILGRYGEVALLDWGLAKWVFEEEEELDEPHPFEGYERVAGLTIPGKVFGTLTHLAPECCFGQPASILSDIYALGVILYQILSLHLPFDRPSVEELAEMVPKEKFIPPSKLAPYRDVPILLSRIAERCLKANPPDRYQSVTNLIHDLEAYLEGQSEWFEVATLDPKNREDWEMAEYVFLPQRLAVTGIAEGREWAKIMISRHSFPGNVRLSAQVRIDEGGEGVGFLINIGEHPHPQAGTTTGYCMWLSTDPVRGSKLFRGGAEVCEIADLRLEYNRWYGVRIEKVGTSLYLFIDDQLIYSYITYLPILGTHVGLLYRDTHYTLERLSVAIGNLSIKVDCLAIPDAFLAAGHYERALGEYRRIGYSFPDRTQGREAMFRAGITLLEEAKRTDDPAERNRLFQLALEEFEELHSTPGAPLEYLGKSLVYLALEDVEDEVNSLELALRRYRNHPLLSTLREQIRVRMFEASRFQRDAAYRYALLATHLMPEILETPDASHHLANLRDHWEPLPFLLAIPDSQDPVIQAASLTIPLAFWLAKPYILLEVLDQLLTKRPQPIALIANLFFCLLEIGCYQILKRKIDELLEEEIDPDLREVSLLLSALALAREENPAHAAQEYLSHIKPTQPHLYLCGIAYLMESALAIQQPELVHYLADHLPTDLSLSPAQQVRLDTLSTWAYLMEDRWQEAGALLSRYPLELIDQETTLLRSLYGCWLAVTEGEELAAIHFSGLLERRYPRSWLLVGHFVAGRITTGGAWENHAFLWERRQLYRQLTLYAHCTGYLEKEMHYRNLERQEYLNVPE